MRLPALPSLPASMTSLSLPPVWLGLGLGLVCLASLMALSSRAFGVDESTGSASAVQETVTQGSYPLPSVVAYEGQDYALTGRALSRAEMELLLPGVTWVYYRFDGSTQWEYHTFDGYALRWNQNTAHVVAGAWQLIDDRICWTYNAPFCRRIWVTERDDLFALPVGPDQPLLPARFEVGDPLGLSQRKIQWLVTQSQDANERRPLNPVSPVIAPQADPNQTDRAMNDNGAPQTFTLE